MRKEKKEALLFIIFIFSLAFYTTIALAEKSEYSLVMFVDNKTINPQENLTIRIYLSGHGNVTNSKILIYSNRNFDVSFSIFGGEWTGPTGGSAAFYGGQLNDFVNCKPYWTEDKTIRCSEFDSSFSPNRTGPFIEAKISNIHLEGEHEVTAVYSYQDMDGDWYSTKSTLKFHVRTLVEIWGLPIAIIGVIAATTTIIGLLIKIYLITRNDRKEKKSKPEIIEKTKEELKPEVKEEIKPKIKEEKNEEKNNP